MEKINLKGYTEKILKENGLFAKKRLGQNFLIDGNILDNIVESAHIDESDLIIEIGPGLGNLTEKLLKTKAKILAFEIDRDMVSILKNRFQEHKNLELIEADILKINLQEYIEKMGVARKCKIVANLPYYITTPIIFKILEQNLNIERMIIMVQKEVADRMVATPGGKEYGILTLTLNYYGKVKKVFDVPNISFLPPPNVTSSVVEIEIGKRYKIENEDRFFELVRSSFSQRRKKVSNSLENGKYMNMSKKEIETMLSNNDISLNARAEEIPIEKYIEMANNSSSLNNSQK